MKTNKNNGTAPPATNKFHSVEFMRKVRNELTQKFFQDKQKYRDFLKAAMEEFKSQQKEVHN